MASLAPSERELRLRERIDTLRDQRDEAEDERRRLRKTVATLIGSRPKKQFRECVYCGAFTYGKACPAHRDLIQRDPLMGGSQS
jgi:hypothetical protein